MHYVKQEADFCISSHVLMLPVNLRHIGPAALKSTIWKRHLCSLWFLTVVCWVHYRVLSLRKQKVKIFGILRNNSEVSSPWLAESPHCPCIISQTIKAELNEGLSQTWLIWDKRCITPAPSEVLIPSAMQSLSLGEGIGLGSLINAAPPILLISSESDKMLNLLNYMK